MTKNILLLPGDGIGPEIIAEAEKILNFFNSKNNQFSISKAQLGGAAIDESGEPYPKETQDKAYAADAILLGAVGGPKWDALGPDKRPEKGLLGIRKHLELFGNLRPAVVFEELADASTLKKEIVAGLDILIVRELTGDVYFGEPKGIEDLPDAQQKAYNTMVYTTSEIERVARVAFDLAEKRGKKVCSIDKSNVLITTQLWKDVVTRIQKEEYPDIELSHMYVDNAAMQLVRNPKQFDVMLTGNIFGDILSDCAAQLTGSLGMLASASLGEKGKDGCNALYEPAHGSAPDIAGQGIANPIATILSLGMMFKYSFDMDKEHDLVYEAVKAVLSKGLRTADIMQPNCTQLSTSEMGDAILSEIEIRF